MEIQDIVIGERTVSRRSFIKGVIAAGATVSSTSYLFRGTGVAYAQAASGTVERLITLNVNGQSRPVDVYPQETLAHVLRYKLGMTGTKWGCDRAECGACTVLVDGVTQYSCSLLAHQVAGREVTTIEGLESPTGELHPVQQGVMDEAGFQCAFCSSPGIWMATVTSTSSRPGGTACLGTASSGSSRCGHGSRWRRSSERG